jgi:hypothetical protein
MFGGIIGVVIGLAFVYLVLSLVCSGITEALSNVLSLRANTLEQGLGRMLSTEGATELYAHRMIKSLTGKDTKKPSYIPPRTFSLALLSTFAPDVLAAGSGTPTKATRDQITSAISQIPIEDVRENLSTLWLATEHDIDRFRTSVEQWFDDTMQRAAGWYTRKAKTVLIVVGLVVAIGVNVDSFVVGSVLWKDPTVRSAVVDAAKAATTPPDSGSTTGTTAIVVPSGCQTSANPATSGAADQVATAVGCLDQLSLPVGWTTKKGDVRRFPPFSGWEFLGRILGWVVTAGALSLGAGFWFNALSNLIGLRATGSKPAATTGTPPGMTSPVAPADS